VRGLGKKAKDIANTCTSHYLKELIESEMPKVIVAEGNLPVRAIRKQFGLPLTEVQVTKNIGKKEIISVDHNNLWLIWCPHPNARFDKEILKKDVIGKICGKIVSILKVS
jgi:uracil-DNA glycosylase